MKPELGETPLCLLDPNSTSETRYLECTPGSPFGCLVGIAELGPLTGDGSGLLIMAIVGGAAIPLGMGFLADRIGLHHAFILPAMCYLYIIYYAFRGSKPLATV